MWSLPVWWLQRRMFFLRGCAGLWRPGEREQDRDPERDRERGGCCIAFYDVALKVVQGGLHCILLVRNQPLRNSLVVQWLGLLVSTAGGAGVPSLVGELRSRMRRSTSKKKKRYRSLKCPIVKGNWTHLLTEGMSKNLQTWFKPTTVISNPYAMESPGELLQLQLPRPHSNQSRISQSGTQVRISYHKPKFKNHCFRQ